MYILYFITSFLLDNDVLETSKRRAMLLNCNILSQIFIVKCFTKSLLIYNMLRINNQNNSRNTGTT